MPLEFSYAFNASCRCYVAVVSEDDPTADPPKVLAAGFHCTEADALNWLAWMKAERPWEKGRSTIAGLSFLKP